jgi:hypothetical protein
VLQHLVEGVDEAHEKGELESVPLDKIKPIEAGRDVHAILLFRLKKIAVESTLEAICPAGGPRPIRW